MKLSFSYEELEIQKSVRQFVRKELLPVGRDIDAKGRMPENMERKFKAMMLLETAIPNDSGEFQGSFTGLVITLKELCYASMTPAWMVFENFLLSFSLAHYGSPELKAAYLGELVSLEKTGALAFTEAETGSDPNQLTTVARKQDNGWLINGSKRFITNSGTCDYMILFARTDETVTAFLIDTRQKGYVAGRRERFIMDPSFDNGELYLNDYFCPGKNVIGDVGQGFDILLKTEAIGKIAFSSFFLGVAKWALDLSITFSMERLHRGKPIGSKFQMVQEKIATMYADYRAMEALLFQVCAKADNSEDIMGDAAVLKLFIARNVLKIVSVAMEIHGAYGLSTGYDIERLYRSAISAQAVMGSMDIQKVIAARCVMNLPEHRR